MNFKKRVNGSWADTPHYIHKTDTDTITTLPADLYPTGTTATVGLKGQTTQSSIPSPTSPVMPQGTGERTGNLIEGMFGGSIGATGGIGSSDQYVIYYVPVTAGETYTISGSYYVYAYYADKPTVGISNSIDNERHFTSQGNTITVISGASWIGIRASSVDIPMVNTGSSPLPFEPYGYKIPISSASTTTPVYLGEVETTRKIYKWVLTGNEAGWFYANGFVYNQSITPDYLRSAAQTVVCSHFKAIPNVKAGGNVGEGECALYSIVGVQRLYFRDSNYTTSVTDFKTYLAQQYAAGTPVTVWYVLATEETGIVNEPLMKIGGYADEVSGISIPVTAGGDSIDIETTVKPSEVSLTYTGWHDSEVIEIT